MSAELLRLCEGFKAVGVRAICYKGPVLGAALYGDPAVRPCGDLDFILSIKDLPEARSVLQQLGYAPLLPLSEKEQAQQAGAQGALVFVNPKSTMAVDLHFTIVPRHLSIHLPVEPMLERAVESAFEGAKVLSLATKDLILLLCVHGTKHCWERLIWLSDVGGAIRKYPDIDWESVLAEADQAGIRRMLLLGVALAEKLFDAELPDQISALYRGDGSIPGLIAAVFRRLEIADEGADAARWLFLLRSRERYRDRISAAVRYALAPRLESWSGKRRAPGLLPVYMARGAARAAARAVRGPQSSRARAV